MLNEGTMVPMHLSIFLGKVYCEVCYADTKSGMPCFVLFLLLSTIL